MRLKNVFGVLLSLLTLVIVGCGGGGTEVSTAPATLTVTTSAASLLINTPATITAKVLRPDGAPVPVGTVVTFTTTGGTLSAITTTNATGDATASLTSAAQGSFTVTATVGALPSQTVTVTFIDPNAPFAVTVDGANSANINTSVVLTATVTPAGTDGAGGPGGTIADGTVVTFASTTPGAAFTPATTVGGVATTTLSGITTPSSVNVTATAGGVVSPQKLVTFVDPTSPASIAMSGAPATGFINGQLPVVITANVVSLGGGPVPAGTPITFGITAGTGGTLTAASPTTDANGNATVTLNSTVEGNITVTATAATATGNVSIAFSNPNKPGAITLTANPTPGVTNGQVPVTLTATVSPAGQGGTIANGTPVAFNILTGTGTISAVTTTTGGVATAVLNSTVAGSVNVNATAGTAPVATSNTVSVPFIAQPTLAVVTVATSGTLPVGTLIGGINATLTYTPTTFTIADTDVTFAGPGLGSGTLPVANTTTAGQVQFALINAGLGNNVINATGAFATLNFHVPVGTFTGPTLALSNISVIDTVGVAIPGVTVVIQNVSLQ